MKKIIVVSGASSGVGLEIVKEFISKEWSVIGMARSKENLEKIKVKNPESFEYYSVDVTSSEKLSQAFSEIKERYGRIDVLINNAAVFKMEEFAQCSISDIDAMIDTNLKGTMYCTYYAIDLMKEDGGRIINIASVSATHGIKGQAIYCASKYGVDGFAEALNQELIPNGIYISTIYPGGIDTPLWNDKTNPYPGEGSVDDILKPGEIVNAVEYIVQLPKNTVLKKIVIFPSNEWH